MLRIAACLALSGWIFACSTPLAPAAEDAAAARSLVTKPGVLVIAHRGDSKVAPEMVLPWIGEGWEAWRKAHPPKQAR